MSHNKIRGNELLDYYGSLLTKHQQNILEDYYVDDLSMAEIATNYNVSKSAISDIINRANEQLEEYERKLKMIKKSSEIDKLIDKMEKEKISKKYINELIKINRG